MFAHLEFFDRKDWGFFHYMLAHFVLGEWWWNHVPPPVRMRLRNSWPWMAYC
jgi:hypothetical protein